MSEDIKSCAKCGENLTTNPQRIRQKNGSRYFCPTLECVPEKDVGKVLKSAVKHWKRLNTENETLKASIQEKDEQIVKKDVEIAELVAQHEREVVRLELELEEAKDDSRWRRTKRLKESLEEVNVKLESSEEHFANLRAKYKRLQRDLQDIFSQQIKASAPADAKAGCASKRKEPMP
jgi:chromosome segregation ATPase